MIQSEVDKVLRYWFADIGENFDVQQQNQVWYSGDQVIDQQIRQQFGHLVENALVGEFDDWTDNAQGALALILLLDQFTRNIYRASHRAFDGDERARKILRSALVQGLDRELTFVQRSFFYMPLEHSESLSDQKRCVELFTKMLEEVPEQGKDMVYSCLQYAQQHRDIIARFGRFPHRNEALGRSSTAQEEQYLQEGGARFGQ